MSDISLAENLTAVTAEIAAAAKRAARDPGAVTLVAASKTFPADHIRPALEAGHRVFGENRVQEAAAKWPALRDEFSGVRLHLIGPLQSNKAGEAVALFDVIETVDREKIARALAKEMAAQDRWPALFIQVNTGEEPQKSGIAPTEALDFVRLARDELGLPVVGLMAIPPADEPPAPHFALLYELAREAALPRVSMGMSGDYPIAVELGATDVRVGSAIFGPRDNH